MGGYEFTTLSKDTVTLSSLNYGHNYPNVSITSPSVYTTSGTIGPFTIGSQTSSSKIRLDGADADIEINGISLLKSMQEIQSRLNILQPNTALEAEWAELFELGKKYKELEQKIKEKQATWDRLKAMPPPEID
jgi:hypothetical protein